MIERVFREQWGRVLASMVGYVGDFDLAEESTQKAFAITLRLPATTATISRRVFPGGPGPDRGRTPVTGTNKPTHRGPAEDE